MAKLHVALVAIVLAHFLQMKVCFSASIIHNTKAVKRDYRDIIVAGIIAERQRVLKYFEHPECEDFSDEFKERPDQNFKIEDFMGKGTMPPAGSHE